MIHILHQEFRFSKKRLAEIPHEKLQVIIDVADLSRPMEKGTSPEEYYDSICSSLGFIYIFIKEYDPNVDYGY